jgi:FkbM family methyltransferase
MKTVAGFAFPDADTFMAREIKPDGSYQRPHLDAALKHVTDFSCAIDGGAHVGTWSALMAGRFTRVIAVEPAADAFECLVQNMRPHANVECRNVALAGSNESGASLALDAKQSARGNTGGRYLSFAKKGSVVCQMVDSWSLKRLGFLKLDVEGYEPFALEGARETLCRCKPVVLFEAKQFHTDRYGLEPHAPEMFLASIGYRFLQAIGHDQIWGAS